MSEQNESRPAVQSLDRAFQILRTFDLDHPARGVSEIARIVGLTPSTTHRLLTSLQENNLVRRTEDGRQFTLGSELMRLAQVARNTVKLTDLARPILTWLRDQTEETAALHIIDPTPGRIVIDQIESLQPLRRTYTDLGELIPLHQGAAGKVLLAHASEGLIELTLSRPLEKVTSRTLTDPVALRERLVSVHKKGYSLSVEERIVGVCTAAVPVMDHTGTVNTAISISGPASRVDRARMMSFLPYLRSGADDLSRELGARRKP
ncbi:IclR family transcriptional regulator [Rhizomonospora bruguierae]|uniref:IclR family transcriptional regulator n=1 Tax=Rhizomonospora bruguierae TaxID=1581705 RepID=UPI001BCFF707|nr:IclR family transcriptional regulator [Micromonospora sp. NBRC 107566]